MRKILLLTIMIGSLALAGCGNNANNSSGAAGSSPAAPETAAPATTAPATASADNELQESAAPETASPSASPATAEQTPAASATKQDYLEKLDAVDAGLSDLQSLREGSTASMIEAADEEYKRWDEALNQIYGELKEQLSESDMAKLKQEQLEWISYRDETAKEASLKFEGGTMQPLEYSSVLASVTKDRCYELVNSYMK
ncbi:lysozyme inhibitor LprI family protein [Paenibacillus tepidiphilus]|uniref:lysozyme inhibitor LprI family protein n=1 Tax=Paenibacillus tepidiphilus TaxID=2608683 RepID=UPI0013A57152|nr:lysozyme inhibitor LprI family protein [Paenibacillus tepidiphilus]